MSAEAVVYRVLSTDPVLMERWNIDENRVFAAHSIDSPLREGPFLIIRWAESSISDNMVSTTEVCTVWAHHAKEDSTDFLPLREILARVREILTELCHEQGEDGFLTTARFNGFSGNFDDPTFQTITKNAEFSIVTR